VYGGAKWLRGMPDQTPFLAETRLDLETRVP